MTRSEIQNRIEVFHDDLLLISRMTDAQVCEHYGVDTRQDAIEGINEEIKYYTHQLEELDQSEDDGMDYKALQQSQGMAVTFW